MLARLAEIAEENVPGTLDDLDTEFLHDLRVVVRRARSVLRELRGRVPARRARTSSRDELRWVQALTGPVRDLDVQLLEWYELIAALPPAPRREPRRRCMSCSHGGASEPSAALQRGLRSARFAGALDEWRSLASLARAGRREGPAASRPADRGGGGDTGSARSTGGWSTTAGRIDDASPPEALHDLRKRGKELRYLLELFGGLFPGAVVKPMVSTLKDLQDVLGRFQDRAVQAEQLRRPRATSSPCSRAGRRR